MNLFILFGGLIIFMLLGVPLGVSMLIPIYLMLLLDPVTTTDYITQFLFDGMSNYSMLALPFFILAGAIMNVGGLSKRLVNIGNHCVGRCTGSLGIVTIISCLFFGSVSGSGPATVAAIGSVMLPEMVKAGYKKEYAVALVAAAGGLGIIVPPSMPMVTYGVTNGVSIKAMFQAGWGPAIVVAIALMVVNYFYAKRNNLRGTESFSIKKLLKALWDGKWSLLMPFIILGGIYGGIFSATEASVVSVIYGIIVGVVIYKEVSIRKIISIFYDQGSFCGGILFSIGPALSLSTVFAFIEMTSTINQAFLALNANSLLVLLVMGAFLFLCGMFLQPNPTIIIFTPLMLQICKSCGIDPIHFGMVVIVSAAIGFITPPVASNINMVALMTGIPFHVVSKSIMKFVVALVVVLLIVILVPQISLIFI